ATAICGLPPLNGFVSEFVIYTGLLHTLGLKQEPGFPVVAFAVPALALMGALAVACFVKVFGVVFLGVGREPHPQAACESPWTMLLPQFALAGCCFAIGLGSTLVAPLLDKVTAIWGGQSLAEAQPLVQAAALPQVSVLAVALIAALAIGTAVLNWRMRTQPLGWTETWGCGYTRPTPRMQYTASSFAQFLVALFGWALQPTAHQPRLTSLFPQSAHFESHVPEVVLDRLVMPAFHLAARILFWFRLMQQGSVQIYLLYVFAILVLLLLVFR
ncbi:MAG TPA: hypothetical protein VFV87_16660, partial [Pirellulaceae bacterium]|nr:hypothetical protein [Pirellulaceae bacterium]